MVGKAVAQEVLNSEQERCAASGHSGGQSPLKHPLITWEKLGLNDRREQKVQLGHVAEKCDCVFLCQLTFVGYLLTSCFSVLFSGYSADFAYFTSEHGRVASLHL